MCDARGERVIFRRRQRIAFESPAARAADAMRAEFHEIGGGLSSTLTVNK